SFLEQAIAFMEQPQSAKIGALTGILLGYDIVQDKLTGKVDSTGIFRRWYGKWYDRGQGQTYDQKQYNQPEPVPAICGALMLCRHKSLKETSLGPNIVLDPNYYMYKEDIDLSLRIRKKGWFLLFHPQFLAYHCRGWKTNRSQVPRQMRL